MSKEIELQKLKEEYDRMDAELKISYENLKRDIEKKYEKWIPRHTMAFTVYSNGGFSVPCVIEQTVKRFFKLVSYLYENSVIDEGKVKFNYRVSDDNVEVSYTFTVPQADAIILENKLRDGLVKI